jgi:hypothetical protein
VLPLRERETVAAVTPARMATSRIETGVVVFI